MMKNTSHWILPKICLNSQFAGPWKLSLETSLDVCFFFPEASPRGFNALLSLHTLGTIWGVTPLLLFRWVTLASLSFWSMCNWEQPPSWNQCPHYFHSQEVFQGCSAILHIILRRADANSLNTEDNPSPISLLTLLLWVCPFRTSDSSPIIILGFSILFRRP